jgi:hypothetical protein
LIFFHLEKFVKPWWRLTLSFLIQLRTLCILKITYYVRVVSVICETWMEQFFWYKFISSICMIENVQIMYKISKWKFENTFIKWGCPFYGLRFLRHIQHLETCDESNYAQHWSYAYSESNI